MIGIALHFIIIRTWFLLPQRYRIRVESFVQKRILSKYSRWNIYAFCSVLWSLGWLTYFENLEEVPYSFRRRFNYMKLEDLRMEANELETQTMEQYQEQMIPRTDPLYCRIRKIVDSLSNQTRINGILEKELELFVIDADIKNAFVTPNGKVFVFTGICEVMNDDDEIGILIGHEIAHVIAAHSAEGLCRESYWLMGDALLFGLLSWTTSENLVFYVQEWFRLQFVNLFTELPFSRQNEHEADYIGLVLAKQCGFDISKGAIMWQKMAESEGDELPEIFSTHPGHVHRSDEITSWMKHVECLGKHCTVF